jgi:hypothetical protein
VRLDTKKAADVLPAACPVLAPPSGVEHPTGWLTPVLGCLIEDSIQLPDCPTTLPRHSMKKHCFGPHVPEIHYINMITEGSLTTSLRIA